MLILPSAGFCKLCRAYDETFGLCAIRLSVHIKANSTEQEGLIAVSPSGPRLSRYQDSSATEILENCLIRSPAYSMTISSHNYALSRGSPHEPQSER